MRCFTQGLWPAAWHQLFVVFIDKQLEMAKEGYLGRDLTANAKVAWSDEINIFENKYTYLPWILYIQLRYWYIN